MKKILFCAAISIMTLAPIAALAGNSSDAVSASKAVHTDQTAISDGENGLATDRAAKAQDKARGNTDKQAVNSTKTGIDQAGIDKKKGESSIDTKPLNSDVDK